MNNQFNSGKYVSKDIFETFQKNTFEKHVEHDRHITSLSGTVENLNKEVSSGFQKVFEAINVSKQETIMGRFGTLRSFFGALVILVGIVVYFGDLKMALMESKHENLKEGIERDIKLSKAESELAIREMQILFLEKYKDKKKQ